MDRDIQSVCGRIVALLMSEASKEKPMKARDIALALGGVGTRSIDVYPFITQLRVQGEPIAHGQDGYWITEDWRDLIKARNYNEGRTKRYNAITGGLSRTIRRMQVKESGQRQVGMFA